MAALAVLAVEDELEEDEDDDDEEEELPSSGSKNAGAALVEGRAKETVDGEGVFASGSREVAIVGLGSVFETFSVAVVLAMP